MIGYFPEPYPDELFYSLCARFTDRMQYRCAESVMIELFGNPLLRAVVDFPRDLGHLVAALPPGHTYTVDQWIDQHTLLPFHAPFIPLLRLAQVRAQMRGEPPGRRTPRRIFHPRVPLPESLRFCPACVEEDRRRLGECYWHRLHQIPGVQVCPVHRTLLEESTARVRNPVTDNAFLSAEKAVWQGPPRAVDQANPCHQMLIEIAQDAAWLLSQNGEAVDLETIRRRYLSDLAERGLTRGRLPDKPRLLRAFTDHYPPELLPLLNCPTDAARHWHWYWVLGLFRTRLLHPPISHLLLMHFLGYTAESFFARLRAHDHPEDQSARLVPASPPRRNQKSDPKTRARYRVLWLSVRKQHPEVGAAKLRHFDHGAYGWLWRHDLEWLNAHKPPVQSGKTGPQVDWNARDLELAEQVRRAAERLRAEPGRPVRVTPKALFRAIGKWEWVSKKENMARLPLTARAVAEVGESYGAIAIRRLQWVVNQPRSEPIPLNRIELLHRAGIYSSVLPAETEPIIQAALDRLAQFP